jgi:hypothetical protein
MPKCVKEGGTHILRKAGEKNSKVNHSEAGEASTGRRAPFATWKV